jgi:hypothetical protein
VVSLCRFARQDGEYLPLPGADEERTC